MMCKFGICIFITKHIFLHILEEMFFMGWMDRYPMWPTKVRVRLAVGCPP